MKETPGEGGPVERTERESAARRRRFLRDTVVAATAALAAPTLLVTAARATDPGQKQSGRRWGLLIDTEKCAEGCSACVTACDAENGIDLVERPPSSSEAMWERQRPQWIRKVKLEDRTTGKRTHLPIMCQHCERPPCVDVCPTGASFRRDDGIVLVDRHICIGCRYCMMACPYKARSFIHQNVSQQVVQAPRGKGCVESCTLCVHRIDRGVEQTACQEACDTAGHRAILFGNLEDPSSPISERLQQEGSVQIRADLELNTGVRYTRV